jgi:hypothetical protein
MRDEAQNHECQEQGVNPEKQRQDQWDSHFQDHQPVD